MRYIASCSMGKDSLAQLVVGAEMGERIDGALYCEVMYTPEISGEIPEHRDFIYNVAIPKLKRRYGIETEVIRSDRTMKDCFYHVSTKGKSIGKVVGFPIPGLCTITGTARCAPSTRGRKRRRNPSRCT